MSDGDSIYAINVLVRIQTPPFYDPRSDKVMAGRQYGFDAYDGLAADPKKALISVSTSKRLNEPCGRFTLTFVPMEVIPGYLWTDLIPSYSLVEIWMQRYPRDQDLVLVMVGLTSATVRTEQYSDRAPHRQVRIHGRELSCIFVDQKTLYLPRPPEQLQPEKVSSQGGLPAIFSEGAALLGMAAIDPQLALVGDSPTAVVSKFVQMCTTGLKTPWNPTAVPLLNLDLPIVVDPSTYKPTQTVLSQLLVFDEARATLFDPNAALPASSQMVRDGVPLWDLMTAWSDPHYQELFVRTVDLRDRLNAIGINRPSQPPPRTTRYAVNELIFRKKPFGGRIDDDGNIVGTRDTGSQFDDEFLNDPLEQLEIRDSDVMELSLGQSAEQSLVNLYYVQPQSLDVNSEADFRALFAPLMDDGTNAPASIRRFGPRMMQVVDYYFRNGGANGTELDVARARAKLLWYWHRYEPLFLRGSYTLKGNPRINVGMRMTHSGRAMGHEFYVTGVSHTMVLGGESPAVLFTTRVDVDRGWPIRM